MDEEKKKKLKLREKAFDKVYYMVLGFVVIVIIFYMYHFAGRNISKDPTDWGVFGDFMGGTLNPLLAFFSFMLLLLNLKLQRDQLDNTEEQLEINRRELEFTRIELAKAADAQIYSSKVMNEQLKTQTIQQFENLFFALIVQLQRRTEYLDERGIIDKIYKDIFKKSFESTQRNERAFNNLVEFIYCIIENINDLLDDKRFGNSQEIFNIQSKYMNILRSIITDKVLTFLIRDIADIVNTNECERKKDILEKFNFFQNISLDSENYQMKFWLINCSYSLFNNSAFGHNKEFTMIKESKITRIFFGKYPLTFEECLYKFFQKQVVFLDSNDGEECLHITVNDGSRISILKQNYEFKISYVNLSFSNFYFDNYKLSLIFVHNELEDKKYQFNIYFDDQNELLEVSEIVKIPLF